MTELKGKKVLVTGGGGFIGSHTVDAFLGRGADVIVVDNFVTGRRDNLSTGAKFYEVNIADPKIEMIVKDEKPDFVYHFAHYTLAFKSTEDPLLDQDSIVGSIRLLKVAKEIGVKKIVFPSSGFVYGNNPKIPVKETEPVHPTSAYVVSKHAVENYLRFFREAYGLPYVIVRYAAIYGPRQVRNALPDYMRKLHSGGQAVMYGTQKTRDYLYIDDVVRANLLMLDVSPDHPDPVYNLGTGIETKLLDLYDKVALLLGRESKPIMEPDRTGDQIRYALDSAKIQQELGWEPKVMLDEGLRRTVESWEGKWDKL
ncbi:MAG: NAD-dependent epimerase/dehydratase family protein [Parcubacteria group bacterium]|nr:NAD-dependent epimerase/dehydratase family protein [Parcubacteria group bacterium]